MLVSVVGPILLARYHSIPAEPRGAREDLPLRMLGRRSSRAAHPGPAFVYAVHDAVMRWDPDMLDHVREALRVAGISGRDVTSILLAINEREGRRLAWGEMGRLPANARLLSGRPGPPVKLKKHLEHIEAALASRSQLATRRARAELPPSISGVAEADVLLGSESSGQLLAAQILYRRPRRAPAPGIAMAIFPASSNGRGARIERDESKGITVCPLPHDEGFTVAFRNAWQIAQDLLDSDFRIPKGPAYRASAVLREVAEIYSVRRDFLVTEVIDCARYVR